MASAPNEHDDSTESLVARCLLAREQGDEAALEHVLASHPERAAAIRAELDAVARLQGSLRRTGIEVPERIGPYRIVDVLGEGGMGTVYRAEQREPVRRLVAIKVIKLGMDSKDVLARFELERRALAAMSHSSIAKVHDAGATGRGQPYFVMELVEGLPLTDYCDKHRLSLEERIDLFSQVCAGVQHAHQKGVIHRDLKPGNILVVREGERAVAKIVDFGLAKATNRDLLAQTIHTEREQLLGTPEYMAPEQASFDHEVIDARADIYSLGVILYELLTGELPFPSQELRQAGWVEIQRKLREDEPMKPSTRLGTAGARASECAGKRRTSLKTLARELRGDLDWIVLKAMAKEPERRYESASGLAADLRRYLDRDPVTAGPPSASYRLRKLAQRYRVQVLAATAVLITAILGTVVAVSYAVLAERRADENAKLAQANGEMAQLAAVVRYDQTIASEKDLYPPWPHNIDALTRWLQNCDRLLARRAEIRQTVDTLRQRALRTGAEAGHAPLTAEIETRRTWTFTDEAPRFLHDTLTGLLDDLADLEANERAAVERRLAWARQIEALSIGRHRARWKEARAAIRASPRYRTPPIDLRPQMGLVPIGANPVTGLWEFYELRSAWDGTSDPDSIQIPTHRLDGTIEVGGDTGILFVLLPGGTFPMGAQKDDPSQPNYDEHALPPESPVHDVTLAPFFLARTELTKGQWKRLSSGEEPSWYRIGVTYEGNPEPIGYAHAVEQVDWTECDRLLRRHGLTLPTEAQWEYGCRAGTTTPWWPGASASDLAGCANVLDQAGERAAPDWGRQEGDFDDQRVALAPVGRYRPNPFGLQDVHGNVWEWCLDEYGAYAGPVSDGNGLRLQGEGPSVRVYRGGGFIVPASIARSSYRVRDAASFRGGHLGLRAAREMK